MKDLLIECQYFGPIGAWKKIAQAKKVLIEAKENYQKKSFRNKAVIIGANGPITLSVPLQKGKNNQKSITEVRINYDEDWVKIHLQTMTSAYGNAPYFDFYFDAVKSILHQHHEKLFELNHTIMNWLIETLGLEVKQSLTSAYLKSIPKDVLDFRGKSIRNGKEGEYQPAYPQVFEEKHGFIPQVSVLDLLFCTGPEARLYLKAGK